MGGGNSSTLQTTPGTSKTPEGLLRCAWSPVCFPGTGSSCIPGELLPPSGPATAPLTADRRVCPIWVRGLWLAGHAGAVAGGQRLPLPPLPHAGLPCRESSLVMLPAHHWLF